MTSYTAYTVSKKITSILKGIQKREELTSCTVLKIQMMVMRYI